MKFKVRHSVGVVFTELFSVLKFSATLWRSTAEHVFFSLKMLV